MGFLFLLVAMGLLVLWAAGSSGLLWRTRHLSREHKAILGKYAISYQRSNSTERQLMERIVATFVHDKEWRGAGIIVAEEMKVMISACAAQLLRGFPDLTLMHFDKILVYPDSYRSHRSGRMHQGEVRPGTGTIVISWDDFVDGYAHSRDAHNVGLHEMAHALWFENSIGDGENYFLQDDLLRQWISVATGEIRRIKAGEAHFFRDYAGTNHAEFFAVAVEYFFEQPLEFRDALPALYAMLSSLLKQDPAAVLVVN